MAVFKEYLRIEVTPSGWFRDRDAASGWPTTNASRRTTATIAAAN
jgi:hypothetical protein